MIAFHQFDLDETLLKFHIGPKVSIIFLKYISFNIHF